MDSVGCGRFSKPGLWCFCVCTGYVATMLSLTATSFVSYFPAAQHEDILSSILGTPGKNTGNESPDFQWQYVPRKNKATLNYPSDFALVFLENPSYQEKLLLADKRVKRLSLDQKYTSKANEHGLGTKEFGLSWSRMSNDKGKKGPDLTNYRFNKFARPRFHLERIHGMAKGRHLIPSLRNRRRSLKFGFSTRRLNIKTTQAILRTLLGRKKFGNKDFQAKGSK